MGDGGSDPGGCERSTASLRGDGAASEATTRRRTRGRCAREDAYLAAWLLTSTWFLYRRHLPISKELAAVTAIAGTVYLARMAWRCWKGCRGFVADRRTT